MPLRSFTRHPAAAVLLSLMVALASRWWTLTRPIAFPVPINSPIGQIAPEIANATNGVQKIWPRLTNAFHSQWQPWLIASQRLPRRQLADLLHQNADAIATGEFNLELWRSGNQITLQFAWPNAHRETATLLPQWLPRSDGTLHWEQSAPLDEQQIDALASAVEPLTYRYSPVRFPLAALGTAPWSWSLLTGGQSLWQVVNVGQRHALIRWLQGIEPSWAGHDPGRSPDDLASYWISGDGQTIAWVGQSPDQPKATWLNAPDGNSIVSTLSAVDISRAEIAYGFIGNRNASDTCKPIPPQFLKQNGAISISTGGQGSTLRIVNWQISIDESIWTLCWSIK